MNRHRRAERARSRPCALRLLALLAITSVTLCSCHDFGSPLPRDRADGIPAAGGASGADATSTGGAGGAVRDAAPTEAVVILRNLAFEPSEIHVKVGTTVRWVQNDPGTFHYVVMGSPGQTTTPLFQSPRLDPGDEYTYVFKEAGTFLYFCSNHSNIMRNAKVVVE